MSHGHIGQRWLKTRQKFPKLLKKAATERLPCALLVGIMVLLLVPA